MSKKNLKNDFYFRSRKSLSVKLSETIGFEIFSYIKLIKVVKKYHFNVLINNSVIELKTNFSIFSANNLINLTENMFYFVYHARNHTFVYCPENNDQL